MATSTKRRPAAPKKKPAAARPTNPLSAAASATRAEDRLRREKARNALSEQRARRVARWKRRGQLAWMVTVAVAAAGWRTGRFMGRHTRKAAAGTYRRVLAPIGRAVNRRAVAPLRSRAAHAWADGRDRLVDWRDDVASFGFGARARDCDHCEHRVPHWAWADHQRDEHGHQRAPDADPAPSASSWAMAADVADGLGWDAMTPNGRGRRGKDQPGWVWSSDPAANVAAWARGLPNALRQARHRRAHREWLIDCACGATVPAKDMNAHLDRCGWRGAGRYGYRDPNRPTPTTSLTPSSTPDPVVVSSVVEREPSGAIPMPSASTPALPGADIVAGAGDDLQIHDMPPLLDAAARHAMAEANVIAMAHQRVLHAEGSDIETSRALGDALTAMLAVAACLQRAAEHARVLADQAHDYRDGTGGQARGALASTFNGQQSYAAAPGAAQIASTGRLQVHDVPVVLRPALDHINVEVDSLSAAFDRMRRAEGADTTISRELGQAVGFLAAVGDGFGKAYTAAERIAAVTPDFRARRGA